MNSVILMDGAQDMDTLLQSVGAGDRYRAAGNRGNGPPIRRYRQHRRALYPDDGDNIEALLRNADCAMYCASARARTSSAFSPMTPDRLAAVNEPLLPGTVEPWPDPGVVCASSQNPGCMLVVPGSRLP